MALAQFLDLSTDHLTEADSELLDAGGSPHGPRVIPHDYGWWVHVPLDPDELDESCASLITEGFSVHFHHLLRAAHQHHCWWINFDRDAEIDPNFWHQSR